jgi:large subunit ribosomal protein L25
MEKFKLKLEAREGQKPNQLRRTGKIPATVYGPGVASENMQVDAREFSRLPAAAYSHVVELEAGKGGNIAALIRHVQRSHTSNEVLNVEFYRVNKDRKITVTVPLKFVGTSPAMTLGGQIMENFTDAEVECLPNDIPDAIEVDMTMIKELDQAIHFGQIKLPPDVKILNPTEEVVVRINSPKVSSDTPAAAAGGGEKPAS